MSITYEAIVFLTDDDAAEPMRILREQGEQAALGYLKRWHQPGEGTLISTRNNPWKDEDSLFRDGEYVMYYNSTIPYIGLVCTAGG